MKSRMYMMIDRTEGGRLLAEKLASYRGVDAVVIALPRGGVVTGYEIARALKLPLDIRAVRKIGHPTNAEYAIGAIDERGATLCNENEVSALDPEWFADARAREWVEAKRRASVYRGGRPPISLAGKTAIIVDDGIATGLTIRLAVRGALREHPTRVIVAVPVGPTDAIEAIRAEGAEVITVEDPTLFRGAVGSHYAQFEQVDDETVVRLLRQAHGHPGDFP